MLLMSESGGRETDSNILYGFEAEFFDLVLHLECLKSSGSWTGILE